MLFGREASQAAKSAWLVGGIVDGGIGVQRIRVLRSGGDGACSSRTWGVAKAEASGYGGHAAGASRGRTGRER